MEERTLAEWRKRAALRQEDLAAASGVSTEAIRRIEYGERDRKGPRMTTIRKISKALEVQPQQVVEFQISVGRPS